MRRRSQVKRGALYTCNPLLPDPLDKRVYGRDCLCPPREARAAANTGADPCGSLTQAAEKMHLAENGKRIAAFIAPPFCYAPARQAWRASDPAWRVETSGLER